MYPITRLEIERRKRGLYSRDVAAKIGVHRTTYSQVERGRLKPYPKFRRNCAEFFGIPEEELFPEVFKNR